MTQLRVIDTIQIASPCSADWGDMTGNERVRHCGLCEKNVYNLSAMTEDQIHRLIVATQGDFCGRLYRRTDGTMLTADCPVGLKAKMRRAARRTWLIAAAFISSLLAGGGLYAFKTFTAPAPVDPGEFIMGDVVEPPPVELGNVDLDHEPVMGRIAR